MQRVVSTTKALGGSGADALIKQPKEEVKLGERIEERQSTPVMKRGRGRGGRGAA